MPHNQRQSIEDVKKEAARLTLKRIQEAKDEAKRQEQAEGADEQTNASKKA